jgi:hypothetical protein
MAQPGSAFARGDWHTNKCNGRLPRSAKHTIDRSAGDRRERYDATEPLAPPGVLNFRSEPFVLSINPMSLFLLSHP